MEYYQVLKKDETMPFAAYMEEPKDYHTKQSKSER